MSTKLKIGDKVMWSGAWGTESPKPAKVVRMDKTQCAHEKYGWSVDEAEWSEKDYLVVTLDNGHWAYGKQISPFS